MAEDKRSSVNVDVGASVIAELKGEVPNSVMERGGHMFLDAISPFTEIGAILGENVRVLRHENISKIFHSAKLHLEKNGKKPEVVTTKFLVPFIEKASAEDDDDLSRLWTSLLTSEVERADLFHISFIDLLSKIGRAEAQIISDLYSKYVADTKSREPLPTNVPFTAPALAALPKSIGDFEGVSKSLENFVFAWSQKMFRSIRSDEDMEVYRNSAIPPFMSNEDSPVARHSRPWVVKYVGHEFNPTDLTSRFYGHETNLYYSQKRESWSLLRHLGLVRQIKIIESNDFVGDKFALEALILTDLGLQLAFSCVKREMSDV